MADQQKKEKPVECLPGQPEICGQRMARVEENLERQVVLINELLAILRGKGMDTGLVGKTNELEQRVAQVQGVFKWVTTALVGLLAAVVGQYFK